MGGIGYIYLGFTMEKLSEEESEVTLELQK